MNKEHDIFFYKDKNGNEPVKDFIEELCKKNTKDSRINLNKIQDYIQILARLGKTAGEPYMKHLEGEIWELRPLKNRIFFVSYINDSFVLLHHFLKKTKKTPRKEIEKAIKEYKEILESEVKNNEK